jgi:hypothetical protein
MQTLKKIMSSDFIKHHYKLSSFRQLNSHSFDDREKNILILCDLTYGTGNAISALRYCKILSESNYVPFLHNVKYINSYKEETVEFRNSLNILKNVIKYKKINLILGLNIWRSGRIINILRKDDKNYEKIPYALIVSGTDANHFILVK